MSKFLLVCGVWLAVGAWYVTRPIQVQRQDGSELLPIATYQMDNLFGHSDGLLRMSDENRAARIALLRPDGSVQDIDFASHTFEDIPKWMEWARKDLHDCWGEHAENDDAEAGEDR